MATEETRLFIALYTDADVGVELANQPRKREFDAVFALELGRSRLSDQEQLDHAISDKRAILTFNIKHFTPLFETYWNAGMEHYGVIVSDQIPVGELLRRTVNLLNTVTAGEMKNNIKYLGEFAERSCSSLPPSARSPGTKSKTRATPGHARCLESALFDALPGLL